MNWRRRRRPGGTRPRPYFSMNSRSQAVQNAAHCCISRRRFSNRSPQLALFSITRATRRSDHECERIGSPQIFEPIGRHASSTYCGDSSVADNSERRELSATVPVWGVSLTRLIECSRSNVDRQGCRYATKNFVGIVVGIACLGPVDSIVESRRYEYPSSPARAPISFSPISPGPVAYAPRPRHRVGRTSGSRFHAIPGASPSRRLILQMEVLLSKHCVNRRLSPWEREQTEFAACADSISQECALTFAGLGRVEKHAHQNRGDVDRGP